MWGMGGGLMMIVFWVAIVFLVIWLVRGLRSENSHFGSLNSKNSLDILKERYAKGEIDRKEFEEKKKDLIN
ncbi:MAG: SHOCT domain-containing protein [Candidatus Pacebacteria bacterium]|nr:SHOCT domain-containing protein [Candidatus Paceibacterota bacterium]